MRWAVGLLCLGVLLLSTLPAHALTCSGGIGPGGATSEGCNPASGHLAARLTTSDGISGILTFDNVSPAQMVQRLVEACSHYVAAHQYPGSTLSLNSCNPVNPPLALTYTGGPLTSLAVAMSMTRCWPPHPPTNFPGYCDTSSGVYNLGQVECFARKVGVDAQCYCGVGFDWSSTRRACVKTIDRVFGQAAPEQCRAQPRFGNPISPLTGAKYHREKLASLGDKRSVEIAYDSTAMVSYGSAAGQVNSTPAPALQAPQALGVLWHLSLQRRLDIKGPGGWTISVEAYRGNGRWVNFTVRETNAANPNTYAPAADINDSLVKVASGWHYRDVAAGALESYDNAGRLLRIDNADGSWLRYTYSDSNTPTEVAPKPGLLITVENERGRQLGLRYHPSAMLRLMRAPDDAETVLGYDRAGNLQAVTWPDSKYRQFLYEEPALPLALTGLLDEQQVRHATYRYDASGVALGTERAAGVDRWSVNHAAVPQWAVVETFQQPNLLYRDHYLINPAGTVLTTPVGSAVAMGSASVLGSPKLTGTDQPAGSGCAASSSAQAYDAKGNLSRHDDFNGNRVCHAYLPSRNLEIARIEGLPNTQACDSVTAAGAALPSGSRKTSTQWHPAWSLATKLAAPGLLTTSVYNGQPDPFANNAIASCAPTTALLPDGSRIAVLCRQVEQATTDTDGSLGFGATVAPGVPAREQRWTYDEHGQMLTHDGPRADVVDRTTYAYHPATTALVTRGDLASITNPAGQVTLYTRYDKLGQLLESTDPNGVTTTRSYDLRQRLKTVTVGTELTQYDWWPTGLLKRVTQPDGSWVDYGYDDAHRLRKVTDTQGNYVEYDLDNAGNRRGETSRDPQGTLRRQLSRSIDALGRVELSTGRE